MSFENQLILLAFSIDPPHLKLIGIFVVLIGGLYSGFIASNRFGLNEDWARKLMTVNLVFLNAPIALFVIWPMQISPEVIWMPVIGVLLLFTISLIGIGVFRLYPLQRKSRASLVLAAGLSNMGYTGGGLVCYAIFGIDALALANIYAVLWLAAVYLVFIPVIKASQHKEQEKSFTIFDKRLMVLPAVLVAFILNYSGVEPLGWIEKLHVIDILVYAASALAFFSIGLRIKLSRLKSYAFLYFPLSAIKFILTPLIALLFIWLLAISGIELTCLYKQVLIIMAISPCAVIMVTISNVFDLDGPLASSVWIVTNTVFFILIVPVLFMIYS